MAKNGTKKTKDNGNGETALAIPDYAVMKHTVEDLNNIITSNLGNANLGPSDLDKIKVPAGGGTTWSIPTLDGEEDTKNFDGVIVAWKDQRAYWAEAYSGGSTPPDCASDDGMMGTGEPGGACDKCPFSQFESAVGDDGKPRPGQACKAVRLMAVVQQDDLVPLLLAAPPTSLGNMRKYFLRLSSRATPYYGVVTRFTLEKAKSQGGIEYSQLSASAIGRLTDGELQKMAGYAQVIGKSLERRSAADGEDYS
jgi:hypothetical protein